ncbi:MAG: hypothetical protein HFH10_05635 [Dorea sp.]|nr:hypothetical protein [Dorea sp.]
MQSISGLIYDAAQPSVSAAGVKEPKAQRFEDEAPEQSLKPRRDEYIPEEKKEPGNNVERCTGSTDKVDREIEKLKREKQELEQRLNTETDEARIKDLKTKLAQVERELRQKDNDTYRRQHASYTFS